jgi:putative intracellular protease/amidase
LQFAEDPECAKFLKDEEAQKLVASTVQLSSVSEKDFDAIFYVGGHGPVIDLPVSEASIKLINDVSRLTLSSLRVLPQERG